MIATMNPTVNIPVLDQGYVKLIETWGSDERIVEAARMSTDKGFQGWEPEVRYVCSECKYTFVDDQPIDREVDCPNKHGRMPYKLIHHGDKKLLAYLYTHKHMTPFEMGGLILEIQAPIFVFREWHRHRTMSYNELSARYTQLPDLFYVPSIERLMTSKQSVTNKQSSEAGFTETEVEVIRHLISESHRHARELYTALLDKGVAREVARVVIPVAQYSRMRASANLRNWLAFLTLRMDKAAQYEIRCYANIVANFVKEIFPHTYDLFIEGIDGLQTKSQLHNAK